MHLQIEAHELQYCFYCPITKMEAYYFSKLFCEGELGFY